MDPELLRISDAVIVAAHPDDEILWFSSILDHCKSIIICFGSSATSQEAWDSGRTSLMNSYPMEKVQFLRVRESGAYGTADWRHPRKDASGIGLRTPNTQYELNAKELACRLRPALALSSYVFTHNPWGEYGNEEHVQVFRVLESLSKELGFRLFVDGYVSNRSFSFMMQNAQSLLPSPLYADTNTTLAGEIRDLYLRHQCWTWVADYEWPAQECFYLVEANSAEQNHAKSTASIPLNYLTKNFNTTWLERLVARKAPQALMRLVKAFNH